MSFYNFQKERELISGAERRNRNPWFVKTGNSVAHTAVDEIRIGDYKYFQQHKTLSDGIVFYYECNDGGSGQYEVFDSIGKLKGELLLTDLIDPPPVTNLLTTATSMYAPLGALRGCWKPIIQGTTQLGDDVYPYCHFSDEVFPNTFKINDSWSIGFWLKGELLVGGANIFGTSNRAGGANPGFQVMTSPGDGNSYLVVVLKNTRGERAVWKQFVDAEWHRYIVTYKGSGGETDVSRIKLYCDGSFESLASGFDDLALDSDFTEPDFYLGSITESDCYLNQVVVWNRELNATEVVVDYNAGKGLFWSPQVFDFNCSAFDRHETEYDNFADETTRGNHEEIIVTKFGAPGSHKTGNGYLDRASLSESANNALPWRNLDERNLLTASEDMEIQTFTIPRDDSGYSWSSPISSGLEPEEVVLYIPPLPQS